MCDNDRLREVAQKKKKKKKKHEDIDTANGNKEEDKEAIEEEENPVSKEIETYKAYFAPLQKGLAKIKKNVEKIKKLKAKDQLATNEKTRKGILTELEEIMTETTVVGQDVRKRLDEVKKLNDEWEKKNPKESAKKQVRENLYYTNLRKFRKEMNEYNEASHGFKQALQDRTRRQLKIVSTEITDQEIETIVESGKADEVLKVAMASDNLKNVIADIQERHKGILKLEHQVMEVYELFRDLAAMVELQQESFDLIDERITRARDFAEEAEIQLQEAAVYQDKARRRLCCLIAIICIVVLIILIPTLTIMMRRRRY